MAQAVEGHRERAPSERLDGPVATAVFFPGEVVRMLDLRGASYAQIRRLFRLARRLRGLPEPVKGDTRWARFTFSDIAAVEIIVAIGGGREALQHGRRLVLGDITAAVAALRCLGFDDPLFEVPMLREGRRILARVGGHLIEPTTAQLAFEVASRRMDEFLRDRSIAGQEIRRAVRAEQRRARPTARRRVLTTGFDDATAIRLA